MGPEFNELWDRYFKDKPDKPVVFGSIVAGAYADHTLLPPGNYITMYVKKMLCRREVTLIQISRSFLLPLTGSSTLSTPLVVERYLALLSTQILYSVRLCEDPYQVR